MVAIITAGFSIISSIYGLLALNSYFTYIENVKKASSYEELSNASFLAWLRAGLGFLPIFKELGVLGKILTHYTNAMAALISKWGT